MNAANADLQAIFKRFRAVAPVWRSQAAIELIVLAMLAAVVLRRDWPEKRSLNIFALYIQAVVGLAFAPASQTTDESQATHYRKRTPYMSIIATIFIGLIVGLVARFLKPGDDKLGWIMTIVLGIAGSFLAGYAGNAMGWYAAGEPVGFIASVIGAIVLLVIYSLIKGKR